MEIEAHLVELENPFTPAQRVFEELVQELSGVETQKKTHSELENLINVRGIEVMRLLVQGHLEARGGSVSLVPVVNNEGKVLPYRRERGRSLESVFGTVWVNRIGYEAKGESMLYPRLWKPEFTKRALLLWCSPAGGHRSSQELVR